MLTEVIHAKELFVCVTTWARVGFEMFFILVRELCAAIGADLAQTIRGVAKGDVFGHTAT
jgi:hypothetical protein